MARKSKKIIKAADDSIPNAELDVLACVWHEGPITAARIRELIQKYRPMAHGSVVTLLTRLESKGMVVREKGQVGKAFLFSAKASPEATHRKMVRGLLQRLFAGDVVAMTQTLLDVQRPTTEQLTNLQRLVAKQGKAPRKN